jgi:hypothetical protein
LGALSEPGWERRKARCSCHIEPEASRLPPLPQEQSKGVPVGVPEGAMLLAHWIQKHRGFRRSHKSRARCPCGSAGRRDALGTLDPEASRLPPLPPKQSIVAPVGVPEGAMLFAHWSQKHRGSRRFHQSRALSPLWERRKARCPSRIEARSIAARAASTKAEHRRPCGAPEGAMPLAHRSQSIAARAAPTRESPPTGAATRRRPIHQLLRTGRAATLCFPADRMP